MYIDFAFKCYEVAEIFGNPYFGMEYGLVYALCLLPYLAAIVLVSIYTCAAETPFTRTVVPWGMLAAAIANLLIAIWICVYICAIYKETMVRKPIHWGDEADTEDEPQNYYVQKKASYVVWTSIGSYINAAVLGYMFYAYQGF